MTWIGKQAAFYRGCLPDDRSLVPLTVLLSTTLALWLLVYLVVAVAEDVGVASVTFIRDRPPANSPIPRDTPAPGQPGHHASHAVVPDKRARPGRSQPR